MKNVTGKSVKTARTVCELMCGRSMNDPYGATLLLTRDRKWIVAGKWANIMEVIDDPEGTPGWGDAYGQAEITAKQAHDILAQDSEAAVKEAEMYCAACGVPDPFERNA
jgi:hypothetical protein